MAVLLLSVVLSKSMAIIFIMANPYAVPFLMFNAMVSTVLNKVFDFVAIYFILSMDLMFYL